MHSEYRYTPRLSHIMETVRLLIKVLMLFSWCAKGSVGNALEKCILPLGMEEGKIPDEAITASSSYEMKSVGPQNARIRQEKNGGAWCPKAQISSAIREYLEIDLTKDHLITWTETQGRFGNGQGQEYAEAFFLEYWRHEKWHQYKDLKGKKVLRGNSNTYLVEKQKLDLPFIASRVRFVPYSQHPRTVCMRVEIYGCIWNQDITSYTAPKADKDGPNGCNVEDTSYDGMEIDNLMLNGLGQLTDSIVGSESEILESNRVTNWVGWHDRDNVEIFFEFQTSRKFRNCTIHVANLPDLSVETFAMVNFWFSSDGKDYHKTPETFQMFNGPKANIILSSSNEKGRSKNSALISIPLQSRIGKFVKMEIKPQSKWLLLSEIIFQTVPDVKNDTDGALTRLSWIYKNINENISKTISQDQIAKIKQIEEKETKDETSDLEIQTDKIRETGDEKKINIQHGRPMTGKPKTDSNETTSILNESNLTPDAFPVNNSPTYIGLISAALTVIVFFSSCTIFLVKQRGRNKVALLQKHTALLCGSPAPGITINTKDIKLPAPIVVNNLSQSRLSLKSKIASNNDYKFGDVDTSEQHSIYEKINKISPEQYVKCEARSNYKTEYFDTKTSENFTDEAQVECIIPTISTKLGHSQTGKINQRVYESYYAATDILTIKRRDQQSVVSLFTPLLIRDSVVSYKCGTYDVPRISRHRLRILDKLGEGNFGLVHLCEAKGIQNPDLGILQNRQVVIVRSLWRGVVDSLREDFMSDMHILAEIRDINIARIIAIVEEEPFSAIFEYGEHGDLSSFLKNRDRDAPISYECSLNLMTQIASGMKYLETLNVPHCDLAARNCIVCKDLLIKVSDQAMYCSKYDGEYYVDECYGKIPLRWMAWEAVLSGKRSCQADVWSYGVTVWEVLMRCEDIPYADLTSEQVLENCGLWYSLDNGGKKKCPRILEQPVFCTDDLYRLMLRCWCKRAEDRSSFQEIYCYLKKLTGLTLD